MGLVTASRVDLIDSSLQSSAGAPVGHSAMEIPWAVWPPGPACSRSDDLPAVDEVRDSCSWGSRKSNRTGPVCCLGSFKAAFVASYSDSLSLGEQVVVMRTELNPVWGETMFQGVPVSWWGQPGMVAGIAALPQAAA